MDDLLLHCDVAHALWVNMFQIFEVQWVMLGNFVGDISLGSIDQIFGIWFLVV